jgi:hypothetical protein
MSYLAIDNIEQRLRQLTARRLPGAVPQLFWHGTSSANLRSVLIYGLDPSKIKSGNWLTDPNINEDNASQISYGGIYYAKSWRTARTYANELVDKDKTGKSKVLLVGVMLQELATLPDEDRLNLNAVVHKILGYNSENKAKTAAAIFVNNIVNTKLNNKYITKFRKAVFDKIKIKPEDIVKRQDSEHLLQTLDAVLFTGAQRYLAHLQARKKRTKADHYMNDSAFIKADHYINKVINDITKNMSNKQLLELIKHDNKSTNKFDLPNIETAEQAFRQAADQALKLLKNYSRRFNLSKPGLQKERTLRSLNPVGFRGRNKIICILEFMNSNDGQRFRHEYIKIHYGAMPKAVDFRSVLPIKWLDRNGKPINDDKLNPSIKKPPVKKGKPMSVASHLQILTAAIKSSKPKKIITHEFNKKITKLPGEPVSKSKKDPGPNNDSDLMRWSKIIQGMGKQAKKPLTTKTPIKRKSPIKSKAHYIWHTYKGEPKVIKSAKGYQVTLSKGHKFGLRPAKSNPDKIRMIHQDTGINKVFSLSKNSATRLIKLSKLIIKK